MLLDEYVKLTQFAFVCPHEEALDVARAWLCALLHELPEGFLASKTKLEQNMVYRGGDFEAIHSEQTDVMLSIVLTTPEHELTKHNLFNICEL